MERIKKAGGATRKALCVLVVAAMACMMMFLAAPKAYAATSVSVSVSVTGSDYASDTFSIQPYILAGTADGNPTTGSFSDGSSTANVAVTDTAVAHVFVITDTSTGHTTLAAQSAFAAANTTSGVTIPPMSTTTSGTTVTATVPTVLTLTNGTGSVALGQLTPGGNAVTKAGGEMTIMCNNAGGYDLKANTLSQSNATLMLNGTPQSAATSYFADYAGTTLAAGDWGVSFDGGTNYTAITDAGVVVKTSSSPSGASGDTITPTYSAKAAANQAAGDYSNTVTYTLTAPAA
jgi:hypothetical protein